MGHFLVNQTSLFKDLIEENKQKQDTTGNKYHDFALKITDYLENNLDYDETKKNKFLEHILEESNNIGEEESSQENKNNTERVEDPYAQNWKLLFFNYFKK
tara:strand:- start:8710 stop:9012 length:303 start_codon:yes stop_codon:yes gene_type:complete